MLFKEIVDERTHGRTDDGRRTPDIEGSQKLTEHFVLRWAKNVSNICSNIGLYFDTLLALFHKLDTSLFFGLVFMNMFL